MTMPSIAARLLLIVCVAYAGAAPAQNPPAAPAQSPTVTAVLNQWSTKHLVMLYRKETDTAPNRLDPTIQATSLALEHEFLNRHFLITQASPDALRAMDQGPDVIVTFAPDAGMSMIYSVYSDVRPEAGTDVGIAEIRIEARIFIGSTLLSAESGRGQMQTKIDPSVAAYGMRRAYELAAQDAAVDLADRVEARLRTLTADDIVNMVGGDETTTTSFSFAAPSPAAGSAAGTASNAAASNAPSNASSNASADPVIAKRWLLAVGVGDYSKVSGVDGEGTHANDLPGTATDVDNVQATMKSLGFDDASIIKLFDQTATTKGVTAALDRLSQSVQLSDELVFYMSGHGVEQNFHKAGSTMPVLYDTNLRDQSSPPLDFAELVRRIARIPAKQIVLILDTCHSGGATTSFTTVTISARGVQVSKTSGAPDLGQVLRQISATRGDMAVMSAAKTDETAIDLGAGRGGLFTSNLLKGLHETRGRTPLQDVYNSFVLPPVLAFCAKSVPNAPPCQQTPVLGYDGAGNMIRIAGNGGG
jgi:hypothetical protein